MALPYAKLSGSVKRQAPQARTCVLFNLGNSTLGQPICRRTQLAFHANIDSNQPPHLHAPDSNYHVVQVV